MPKVVTPQMSASVRLSEVAALLDRMLDGCAVYDAVREHGVIVDFERIHMNPAGARLRAATGADLTSTRLKESAPGVVTEGLFQRYVEVVETQTPWSGADVSYRDGSRIGIYDIQAWPVNDGFAVTWREVTDRERVLEQLRLSEQRFRATVDQLPDAVSVFESVRDSQDLIVDFRWIYCNRYNAEMTGYTVEALIGQRLLEVFPEQAPAGMIDVYSQVVESGASWEQPTVWYEDTWGDGSRRRRAFDVRASKVGDGFVVVSRDVTDLRLTTESLEAKEKELHEAQHLARLGSWSHDPATGLSDWSPELFDILGLDQSQTPSMQTLASSVHRLDAVRTGAALGVVMHQGGEFDLSYRINRPDGAIRNVHARGRVETDADGAPTIARGTLLDETEVIRVSAALAEANRQLEESNQSLSDLIGIIGHDLRNPLTASLGFMDFVEHDLATGNVDRARQMTLRAREAGRRVAGLLTDILEMSRLDSGILTSNPVSVDINETIEQALRDLGNQSDVEVSVPAHLEARADPSQLRQVLGNLITNAQKYGAPPIGVTSRLKGSNLEILVTDEGAGVSEDFLPRLFNRFSRAENQTQPGTGLGLYLARQLCRAMEGDLTYEAATRDHGPRFIIRLASESPHSGGPS